VSGGRLSEAQPDHLRIAAGVHDRGIVKGLIILVVSLHLIKLGLVLFRRNHRQTAGEGEHFARPFPVRFNMRMEFCLKGSDCCASTFNFDKMVQLREMPDASIQIGLPIVSSQNDDPDFLDVQTSMFLVEEVR